MRSPVCGQHMRICPALTQVRARQDMCCLTCAAPLSDILEACSSAVHSIVGAVEYLANGAHPGRMSAPWRFSTCAV